MTASGDLTFVASKNLGTLGPVEGTPFTFPWRRIYSFVPLLPWTLLLLCLCLKPNRKPAAWLVWIPCLIVVAIVSSARSIPFVGSQVPIPIIWLGIALGCLWLLSYRLPVLGGMRAFVHSLGVLWLVGAISVICEAGGAITAKMAGTVFANLIGYVILATATAIALALAVRIGRRQDSVFLLAVVFSLILACLSALPPALLAIFAMATQGAMLFSIVVFGAIAGIVFSIVVMPFLLLARWVPFYGERLMAIWHPIPPESTIQTGTTIQSLPTVLSDSVLPTSNEPGPPEQNP